MLKRENLFDDYAYRVAMRYLANPKTPLEDGSWVSLDAQGKVIPSDGTKMSFLNKTSNRVGRDNVSSQGVSPKASYYLGKIEATVVNTDGKNVTFDGTKTFGMLTPLKVVKDATTGQGILTPVESTDTALVVAYSIGAPTTGTEPSLRIMTV